MNAQMLKDKVLRADGQREAVRSLLSSALARIESLERRKRGIDMATTVIQAVARDTQDQLRVRLEDVVQTALDVVFPAKYIFHAEFVTRRGRTELDLWLDKDGTRIDDILNGNGGGVVDVISLALRICCLTLSTHERILLLDEPFKFIRGKARQRLGDMLSAISRQLGIQVIMVADVSDTGIVPDKEFNVSMKARRSVVVAREPESAAV